jgi:hypothetical protein
MLELTVSSPAYLARLVTIAEYIPGASKRGTPPAEWDEHWARCRPG